MQNITTLLATLAPQVGAVVQAGLLINKAFLAIKTASEQGRDLTKSELDAIFSEADRAEADWAAQVARAKQLRGGS